MGLGSSRARKERNKENESSTFSLLLKAPGRAFLNLSFVFREDERQTGADDTQREIGQGGVSGSGRLCTDGSHRFGQKNAAVARRRRVDDVRRAFYCEN